MAALLPSSAQIRTNLGIDLYLDRQFERAADQLREATRLDANLFSAHLFTGLSCSGYRLRMRPSGHCLQPSG